MEDAPDHIHLHRIDPDRNMYRFYGLTLQPTLFGGASVIRNWGRIGTQGQAMVQTFDDIDEASGALKRIEATKRRRGYRSPIVDGKTEA
jgi:predicted DNA-binding WGR domain protein